MKHNDHQFEGDTKGSEAKTRVVMILTGTMMLVEITAGTIFNSMALLADGWHMGTHLAAFLIAVIAYSFARRNKSNRRYSFGTGKIGALGGFTSSILLVCVAAVMIFESVLRLVNPVKIDFSNALIVAFVGLVVNLVSAFILKDQPHDHSHGGHSHESNHSHDQNLRAAYIHVIADAFTSVTAITALVIGFFFGVVWVDSVMGLLGSAVIVWWAYGIVKDTSAVLVDYTPKETDLVDEIQKAFGSLEGTNIEDLHVWQVSPGKYASIIYIEAESPKSLEFYHSLVDMHEELVHTTIQVGKRA